MQNKIFAPNKKLITLKIVEYLNNYNNKVSTFKFYQDFYKFNEYYMFRIYSFLCLKFDIKTNLYEFIYKKFYEDIIFYIPIYNNRNEKKLTIESLTTLDLQSILYEIILIILEYNLNNGVNNE